MNDIAQRMLIVARSKKRDEKYKKKDPSMYEIRIEHSKPLPPKPGEPETWEKVEVIKNRLVLETEEDMIKAGEIIEADYAKIEHLSDTIMPSRGLTPYEREYVAPVINQIVYDIGQIAESKFSDAYDKYCEEKAEREKAKDAESVNKSIEAMSGTVDKIINTANWMPGFLKRSTKTNK